MASRFNLNLYLSSVNVNASFNASFNANANANANVNVTVNVNVSVKCHFLHNLRLAKNDVHGRRGKNTAPLFKLDQVGVDVCCN